MSLATAETEPTRADLLAALEGLAVRLTRLRDTLVRATAEENAR